MKKSILFIASFLFVLTFTSAQTVVVPNGPGAILPSPNSGVGIGTTNPWWQFRATIDGANNRNALICQTNLADGWGYNTLIRVTNDLTKAFVVENTNGIGDIFTIYGKGTVHTRSFFAEEIRVVPNAMDPWPDYVFESSYDLKPLSEVEQFIQKHKHLPNIPSAKEVAEKGIDLAEMDAALLEKIEELTLYVIDLKKEIENLKK